MVCNLSQRERWQMNSKKSAIVNFIAQELNSFIYILSVVSGALLGGALVAFIPLCAILVGFYNL